MTTGDNNIEKLSENQVTLAVMQIERWIEREKPADFLIECSEIVKHALNDLIHPNSAFGFSLTKQLPVFSREYAPHFSKAAIFHIKDFAYSEIPGQLFWILSLIHAFYYEKFLMEEELEELGYRVLAYFPRHSKEIPWNTMAQVEVEKAKITTSVAVNRQMDVRNEIESLTKNCFNQMTPLVERIAAWNGELGDWESKTDKLKKYIEKQKSNLNFVGLSLAFDKLIRAKKKELWLQVALMLAIALALLSAIIAPAYYIFVDNIMYESVMQWAVHTVPILGVEILLLYFFRIALRNFYSAKAQLLQLDLRYALCAFIEGYTDFKNGLDIKPEDKGLEKFESLIFSGVTADIQNIPSQFDGIEQLAALIKAARSNN